MNATLTVSLDAEILRLAEREAEARKMTLPEMVERQLKIMAQNWRDSQAGRIPITDELRGSLELPAGRDEREILTEALREKYGG